MADETHEFKPVMARGTSGWAVICGHGHDHLDAELSGGCYKGEFDPVHSARNQHQYAAPPEGFPRSAGCRLCGLDEGHAAHAVGQIVTAIARRQWSFTGNVHYITMNGFTVPHLRIRAAGRMVAVSIKAMFDRLQLAEGDEAEITIRVIRRLPDTSGVRVDDSMPEVED